MEEKKVKLTIEATKWELSELFGAVRLGVWLEDWCATLTQAAIDSYDTHSYKWCMRVLHQLEKMEKQTGITYESKEYAQDEWAVTLIEAFVDKKAGEFTNDYKRKREGLDIQNKMLNNDKDE
jgi:hypothetical protein